MSRKSLNFQQLCENSSISSSMRLPNTTHYPNNKRNTLNTFLRLVFGIYLDPMGIIAYHSNLQVVGRCAVVEPRCGVRPFRSRTS